jgi:hypothetical protein
MAGRNLDDDFIIGASNKARIASGFSEHWRYPDTVGNDTQVDDLNFNSHQTSEYAKLRMDKISAMTHEPFMLFEFMKVDNDDFGSKTSQFVANKSAALWGASGGDMGNAVLDSGEAVVTGAVGATAAAVKKVSEDGVLEAAKQAAEATYNKIKDWASSIGTLVNRKYVGSVALYMPTDIQINDQMVYNDDSRKMGAFAETLFSDNYADVFNPVSMTSQTALTAGGFLAGKIPGLGGGASSIMGALAGAGLAEVVGTEIQRGSGKAANPNEILLYGSTQLRTFTFNWIILPDSAKESEQATGLIKMFRKSAHARKDNKMIVTVPDHVVVSFHGAGAKNTEMIQLPPCVIESVNVTYNPNASSFFKQNNAPVEIGFGITLKEMAPIYSGDVEAGY